MKFLALDTTKSFSHIIVANNNKVDITVLNETRKISEMLLLSINNILTKNDLQLNDCNFFACVIGPGSFTGVRIGMSTIKAFNAVLNKKLITLNSFEVLANEVKNGCIILFCTKNTFYFANVKNKKIIEIGVDNFSNIENEKYSQKFACEEELRKYCDYFIENYSEVLFNAIIKKMKNNEFADANKFIPLYLQQSQAERNFKIITKK